MKDFSIQVDEALQAASEEDLEAASKLFEEFINLIQNKNFEDFESLYRLANFLISGYWPDSGMFAEVSSQLFAEYEIGNIDWIWEDKNFQQIMSRFLQDGLHFGCFVLTEGRSNVDFNRRFADLAYAQSCGICDEIGDGWLEPRAYLCESAQSPVDVLENFSELGFKLLESLDEQDKFEGVLILRALAANPNTPRNILEMLTKVNFQSIRHEIRNINGDMFQDEAEQDSFVDWKARQTLNSL